MHISNYQDDIDYIQSRFNHTVNFANINGKRELVYVYDIMHKDHEVMCQTLPYDHSGGRRIPIKDLDLTPIRLGYCNNKLSTNYISRKPTRFYKQGLCKDNLQGSGVDFNSQAFYNMVNGKYPKPLRALELVMNQEALSVAFSRNFAVSTNNLFYRDLHVGKVSWNGHSNNLNYQLKEEHDYLQETLDEDLVGT